MRKMPSQPPVFSASCTALAGIGRHSRIAFPITIPVFLLCLAGSSYAFQTAPGTPTPPVQDQKPSSVVGQAPDPVKMGAAPAGGKVMGAAPVDRTTYTIGAEDVLQIIVWGNRDISGSYIVRPDGMISVPLIKEVEASGKTPSQLEESIAQALKDRKMVIDPNVTVSVGQVHSRKYYIQGEVNKPGVYDLAVPTTILEGLVNAGGFRDFAKRSKIRILRGSKELKFNYDQVVHAKHLEQNVMLEPGDQIIVP